MGLSSCMASCLAEQTTLSELNLDCTMTRTIDAVFHIVFACVCDRDCDFYKCIRDGVGTATVTLGKGWDEDSFCWLWMKF